VCNYYVWDVRQAARVASNLTYSEASTLADVLESSRLRPFIVMEA
jgi:hypothetical protein